MPENKVGVTITTDIQQLRKEIDSSIKQLDQFAKNTNAFNQTAVKAFRESAQAEKELNAELGATEQQTERLNDVIRRFESRVETAGKQTANATERMGRGLSYVASQGELTVSSINQIVAAGGDLAFSFGPNGAIISGILMVTAAITTHLVSTEMEMEKLVRDFENHVNDILLNGDAVSAAKQAARAYVDELAAARRQKESADAAAAAGMGFSAFNPDRYVAQAAGAVRGFFTGRGAQQDFDAAHNTRMAAEHAGDILTQLDVNEKQLDALTKQRQQLNNDIAQAQTKLQGMEQKGHEAEYAAVQKALDDAKARLARAERETVDLEARRRSAYIGAILNEKNEDTKAALSERFKGLKGADFAGEHSDRDFDIARGASGAAENRARGRDQATREAQQKRDQDAKQRQDAEKRALAELQQVRDDATERYVRQELGEAAGDLARINLDFGRKKAAIEENTMITEETKTALILALTQDRAAQVLSLEQKVQAAQLKQQQDANKREADEARKHAQEQTRIAEQKVRLVEGVVRGSIHSLADAARQVGRAVLRAEIEPIIKAIEAEAKRDFVRSAAAFARQDYVHGALWAASGAVLAAGAGEIASLAEGGGGSGGGRGGGGGGGSTRAATELGAGSSSGEQMVKIELVLIQKEQSGREVARTNQTIQRLNDRNTPIRVTL